MTLDLLPRLLSKDVRAVCLFCGDLPLIETASTLQCPNCERIYSRDVIPTASNRNDVGPTSDEVVWANNSSRNGRYFHHAFDPDHGMSLCGFLDFEQASVGQVGTLAELTETDYLPCQLCVNLIARNTRRSLLPPKPPKRRYLRRTRQSV